MGLDMYVYRVKESDVVSQNKDVDVELVQDKDPNILIEKLFCWRKHNSLHDWMMSLYAEKGGREEFNCQKVSLTLEDLEQLEQNIHDGEIEYSFGEGKDNDLDFVTLAREALNSGDVLFYGSWW